MNIHINKNKNKIQLNTCIYHIFICIIPLWCLKINRSSRAVKGISLQFNTDPRSQLGNFSYKLCMLSTPNGLNYLVSICILQFDLFQVNLPLQYILLMYHSKNYNNINHAFLQKGKYKSFS